MAVSTDACRTAPLVILANRRAQAKLVVERHIRVVKAQRIHAALRVRVCALTSVSNGAAVPINDNCRITRR